MGGCPLQTFNLQLQPPSTSTVNKIDFSEEKITTDDGVEIAFDHYPSGHENIIIIAPGFYNSKQAVLFKQMAQRLCDQYDIIVMDFRGHGRSKGLFTWTANEDKDLLGVLKFVEGKYKKLGIIGFSLGAAVGLITAAKSKQIDSLIAVCSPSQFDKIDLKVWNMGIKENIVYTFFQEGRIGKGVRPGSLWIKKIKPIDIIDKITIPIYFMHGVEDWLILPWHSEALFKKANCSKKIELIEGATHAEYIFRSFPDDTIKRFKTWFAETLNN